MYQGLQSYSNQQKTTAIITSIAALSGIVYSMSKRKTFAGIIGYTLLFTAGGALLSTAVNKTFSK
jgi:hypothetical protein